MHKEHIIYRVVPPFVDTDITIELCFSERHLYCNGTFNLMSTNCFPRQDGPPCTTSPALLTSRW